jgi:hypothetical protein
MKLEAAVRRKAKATPRYAHMTDNTQPLLCGRAGPLAGDPGRGEGGGEEPHMIKQPTDLLLPPPLAVSHAVLVAHSHMGETF